MTEAVAIKFRDDPKQIEQGIKRGMDCVQALKTVGEPIQAVFSLPNGTWSIPVPKTPEAV
jgi:hypothetical protein